MDIAKYGELMKRMQLDPLEVVRGLALFVHEETLSQDKLITNYKEYEEHTLQKKLQHRSGYGLNKAGYYRWEKN